ncbi:MAG: hypothetical protein AVDCRST_MAG30-926, partial [uncultured Solirubrobacteraceae bacterium]
ERGHGLLHAPRRVRGERLGQGAHAAAAGRRPALRARLAAGARGRRAAARRGPRADRRVGHAPRAGDGAGDRRGARPAGRDARGAARGPPVRRLLRRLPRVRGDRHPAVASHRAARLRRAGGRVLRRHPRPRPDGAGGACRARRRAPRHGRQPPQLPALLPRRGALRRRLRARARPPALQRGAREHRHQRVPARPAGDGRHLVRRVVADDLERPGAPV